jgi:hypothetical protein
MGEREIHRNRLLGQYRSIAPQLRLNKLQKPATHGVASVNSCEFRIDRINSYKVRRVPSRRIATEKRLRRETSQFFVACERHSR